ncbi:MAG: CinA family nicotinamide mononucleotide deamidase-related protein, partial [Anaerolineae bacterium]
LLGEIVDTNSTYIARQLREVGLNLYYKTSVGDNEERMAMVLRQALARSDVIIITGGLGPTVDDVTRQAVAQATGRELVFIPELWEQIHARFARWGREPTDNNRRQAYMPSGATPVENPVGTAPCFIVDGDEGLIISLPGVPREMKYLMEHSVIPFLRERLGLREIIKAKVLRTAGVGESTIDDLICDLMTEANPTVGLSAHAGQTDVRIAAKAESEAAADALIAGMEARVRERLGHWIYGQGKQLLEEALVEALRQSGHSLAVLETNSRGAIAQRLANVPGSQDVFRGGLVAPEGGGLTQSLGVPEPFIAQHGFPSCEVAAEVARRLRSAYNASLGLAALGTASEAEGLYGQETGHTCVALAGLAEPVLRQFTIGGSARLSQIWVSTRALDLVRRAVLGMLEN